MVTCYETRHESCDTLSAHRHRLPYVALVLDGGYVEASVDGRFACRAGTVIVHPAWHEHSNEFGPGGAVVLNLPARRVDGLRVADVADSTALERLARSNPDAAADAALEEAIARPPVAPARWLARFVASLASDDSSDIATLAAAAGVSAEHASRSCRRWFGQSPTALRREKRLRRAIDLVGRGATPAEAAVAAGFSDQPHFTRLLKRATGLTPARLPRV